jgi:hypothetical protein
MIRRMKPIKIRGREVGLNKAVTQPLLGTRNVLTNSPWMFVSLWLRRNKKKNDALFYWEQAREFYDISVGLPSASAPLLLYYCFMNATKALLAAKSVSFNEYHGLKSHSMRRPGSKIGLTNEGIRILNQGVLPSLSTLYGEPEISKTHNLQELFFNMVFVHRTYCLTYTSQHEMFLPLTNCRYMFNEQSGLVFLCADFEKNVPVKNAMRRLPTSFVADTSLGERAIRSIAAATWSRPCKSLRA